MISMAVVGFLGSTFIHSLVVPLDYRSEDGRRRAWCVFTAPLLVSLLTDQVPGSLWIYAPNQGAPVFFAVAFAISAAFHFWQCW